MWGIKITKKKKKKKKKLHRNDSLLNTYKMHDIDTAVLFSVCVQTKTPTSTRNTWTLEPVHLVSCLFLFGLQTNRSSLAKLTVEWPFYGPVWFVLAFESVNGHALRILTFYYANTWTRPSSPQAGMLGRANVLCKISRKSKFRITWFCSHIY